MPEYDAFGREVGENPLRDLGWKPEHEPDPEWPSAAPRPEAGGTHAGPPRLRVVRRRSGGCAGPLIALLVGAVVIAALAVSAVTVVEEEDASAPISGGQGIAPSVTAPAPEAATGDGPAAGKDPVGVRPGSLLLRSNFAGALATLRAKRLGSVHSLRVAPERINGQFKTAAGRLRSVEIRFDGSFRQFSVSGPGFGGLPTVPFSQIDRSAPYRLVARSAGRLKTSADGIDYLVLSAPLGTPQWGAYFKSGAIFLADSRGSITRKIG